MMYKLTLALALLPAAFAANYTTSLLLLGFPTQTIVGSVVATDATATTYALTCAGADAENCGIPPDFTLTQGPSTMHYTFSADGDTGPGHVDAACVITSDHGVCSGSMVYDGTVTAASDEQVTMTTSYTDFAKGTGGQVVTVTAMAKGVSTGGMPMITAQAQWVVGGAAAVAALAAL